MTKIAKLTLDFASVLRIPNIKTIHKTRKNPIVLIYPTISE